jgi:hypothetical protein
MAFMDDTRIDQLLTELESADPANAPDIADEVASSLSDELEADDGEPTGSPPA